MFNKRFRKNTEEMQNIIIMKSKRMIILGVMLLGIFKIFIKIIVYKNSILFPNRKVFVLPTGGYLNSNGIITAMSPDSISYSNLVLMLENPRHFNYTHPKFFKHFAII